MRLSFWGALFISAVPLFSQSELSGIQLLESPTDIKHVLGEPTLVSEVNPEFRAWQYRLGDIDHDDFSHALIFRKSTNNLVSISRTFEHPVNVERLFAASPSTYYRYPEAGPTEMIVRVRRLGQERLLLAFGSAKQGDLTTQVVLIEQSVLRVFYPWLADQLKATDQK